MKPPAKAMLATKNVQERFDLEEEEIEEIEVVEDSTGVMRTDYKGEADIQTFDDLIGLGDDGGDTVTAESSKHGSSQGPDLLDEMLGISTPVETPSPSQSKPDDFGMDAFGDDSNDSSSQFQYCRVPEKQLVEDTEASKAGNTGLNLRGSFQRKNEKLMLELNFKN